VIGYFVGPGHGWWPLWILVGGLFQVALVVGVVLLVATLIRRDHRPPAPTRPASLHILEERYARGEIGREEFLERRAVLLGQPMATPSTAGQTGPSPPPPPTAGS
jgi:putative membrane protein